MTLKILSAAILLASTPLFGQKSDLVAGYFPEWAVYGSFYPKNLITSGSAPLLTHILYAFAAIDNNACVSADPWADYQVPYTADNSVSGRADNSAPNALKGNFHQLMELKLRYPSIRFLISIGGANGSAPFPVAAQPQNRKAFVSSCIDMFIKGNFAPGMQYPGLFDGVDIDWEYPDSTDTQNFTALLGEFRRQLHAVRPGMLLTIASPAGQWAYQNINLPAVSQYLSFFNVMTYDYDGPWNSVTGFVSPLYQAATDPSVDNNIASSIQGYLAAGVPANKMVMGTPFYSYSWTGVPATNNGLFQPGTPGSQGSTYPYILSIESQYTQYRDTITQEPWLYDGNTFWTYDDPVSIAFKMDYLKRQGLRGAMMWDLSDDTTDGQLLKAIAYGLK